jgi:hypothetical protein
MQVPVANLEALQHREAGIAVVAYSTAAHNIDLTPDTDHTHLQQACVITHIHKNQTSQVPVPVYPATHSDFPTNICFCHIASTMTPCGPTHGPLQCMGGIACCICFYMIYLSCCFQALYALRASAS